MVRHFGSYKSLSCTLGKESFLVICILKCLCMKLVSGVLLSLPNNLKWSTRAWLIAIHVPFSMPPTVHSGHGHLIIVSATKATQVM